MRGSRPISGLEWTVMVLISTLLMAASHFGWWPISLTESLGFASGGVCVWLVVRQHIANWPVGLANNVFFFVLFLQSRLYADMGLQVVYFGLGVWGWWNWLYGGERRTGLRISRATGREWIALAAFVPLGTWALADHYRTLWVPEYGRELSEKKLARAEMQWRSEEFETVALEQNRREAAAARKANRVLIGDTNSFATVQWHRRYMGTHSEAVARIAAQNKCDLYLLTGDEIPFVQDGLRDGEHVRHEMHGWFVKALQGQETPWVLVTGGNRERLEIAVRNVNKLFRNSAWKPAPPV